MGQMMYMCLLADHCWARCTPSKRQIGRDRWTALLGNKISCLEPNMKVISWNHRCFRMYDHTRGSTGFMLSNINLSLKFTYGKGQDEIQLDNIETELNK